MNRFVSFKARESQRHLRGEWDSVLSDLQTHTIRLHSLDDDIKQLHEVRCRKISNSLLEGYYYHMCIVTDDSVVVRNSTKRGAAKKLWK